MHLLGVDSNQHGEITGEHQSLDVMGVGAVASLLDGALQARHIGLGRPIEFRQRAGVVEVVPIKVFRHETPVDAANELAPADDLPDEAFHRVQGRMAILIGRFGALAYGDRVKQPNMQVAREPNDRGISDSCSIAS